MSLHLVTSILFDGSLALEWEEGSPADSPDRPSVAKATEGDTQRLERLLLEVSKTIRAVKPGQWLLVLGLSESSIPLSPSLDFWRGFA